MKKITGVLVSALALALVLAGCGGSNDTAEDAPTQAAASAVATSTKPSPTKTTKKAPDPHKWAKKLENQLKTNTGVKKFQNVCGNGAGTEWLCYITKIDSTSYGTLNVTEQTDMTKDEAEKAAVKVFNLLGPDHPELDFVVIYGGDGVVIGQVPRYKVPSLN